MKLKIKFVLLALSIASLQSCYYDNLEEIHAADDLFTPCDTSGTISYSSDIVPILVNNCGANNSCHQSGTSDSDLPLDNIQNVRDYVFDGTLMGSILHESGYNAMPKDGGSLSSCSIQKIQAWINRGTLDN
ncbi:MAG: hypothetical protein EYC69_10185 [Bacteroidetes bacterium]|nr:MAG: hypothetical protein EYC69_10185 [Bacteroidota bacterium]